MSKRYGRNQKRRHRQMISDLTKSALVASQGAEHARRSLALLKSAVSDWDEEIRRLLGTDTAFRFETARHDGAGRTVDRVPLKQRFSFAASSAGDTIAPADVGALTERMRSYIVKIEKDLMRWQRLIRFIEVSPRSGGEEVVYAISETLRADGFGVRDIDAMSMMIAEQMARHLNERRP